MQNQCPSPIVTAGTANCTIVAEEKLILFRSETDYQHTIEIPVIKITAGRVSYQEIISLSGL